MNGLLSIFSFLFVIALLIAVHEWGHYRMATFVGVRVIRFSLGFGPSLFKWIPKRQPLLDGRPQTTEFVIATLPLGGYVKMQDERELDQLPIAANQLPQSFNRKPLWARTAVVAAGPLANLLLAIVLFTVLNWVGQKLPTAKIIEVIANSAAADAQLEVGDVVLRVDDRVISDSIQLREIIRASTQGFTQTWLVDRQGRQLMINVTPRVLMESSEFTGKEQIGRVGAVIGSSQELTMVQLGFFDGLIDGIQKTWNLSALTLKTLWRMLWGEASLKNLTGPMTVAEYSGKTAAMGLTTFTLFLGLMSVSLGVLNLLPLPMLDGGHLMYYLWELLTGKEVSSEWLDKLQRFGFVLLIFLTILALYNDVVRLFGLRSFFS